MKLTFLGTSAGESYPGIWCDCPNCTYARKHGGKNIRMNTGTMLDDDTLLDLNSCGFYTAARLGISLTKVTTLLATHAHGDHIMPEPLEWRRCAPGLAELPLDEQMALISPTFTNIPLMTVYGNAFVEEKLVKAHPEEFKNDGDNDYHLRFRRIREFERTQAGDMFFTPVRSIHGDKPDFAHSYIIERGGKTLLYALDCGGFEDDRWTEVLKHKYDIVVNEGTFGNSRVMTDTHMTRQKDIAFRKKLLENGCITEDTPCILTHLCPHWTPPHDLYAPEMEKEGFIVAYDGMTFEI